MRHVVVSAFVSLDGVAEAPDRFPTAWDDDVMDDFMSVALRRQDDVILGRRTFDEWAPFWPTADIEPFAGFINAVPKHIATSTPLDHTWAGANVVPGELLGFVRQLVAGPGGDIGVHGSLSIVHSLLAADLVDELILAVVPVLAGSGRRLLDGAQAHRLDPVRSLVSPTGKLLVHLQVAR